MLSQLKAIEKFNEALVLRLNIGAAALADLVDDIRTLQLQMKEQREDYHAHIRQLVEENETLVRDVEALKLQMKNILPKPRIKKGTASCKNDEKEY